MQFWGARLYSNLSNLQISPPPKKPLVIEQNIDQQTYCVPPPKKKLRPAFFFAKSIHLRRHHPSNTKLPVASGDASSSKPKLSTSEASDWTAAFSAAAEAAWSCSKKPWVAKRRQRWVVSFLRVFTLNKNRAPSFEQIGVLNIVYTPTKTNIEAKKGDFH